MYFSYHIGKENFLLAFCKLYKTIIAKIEAICQMYFSYHIGKENFLLAPI